jgi:hypothetical protein
MFDLCDTTISLQELKDFELDSFTRLVHSLRGFACNASFLVYGYQLFIATEYNLENNKLYMSNDDYAYNFYKYHAYRSDVIIRLRKSCEQKANALSSGSICKLLSDNNNIYKLKEYIEKYKSELPDSFYNYIKYIKFYCTKISTPTKYISDDSEYLLKKIALLRRFANKEMAHITFDDYNIDCADVHDVFMTVSAIAYAIQSIMGDLACGIKLELAEKMGYDMACKNINANDLDKYIPEIQENLPIWINLI